MEYQLIARRGPDGGSAGGENGQVSRRFLFVSLGFRLTGGVSVCPAPSGPSVAEGALGEGKSNEFLSLQWLRILVHESRGVRPGGDNSGGCVNKVAPPTSIRPAVEWVRVPAGAGEECFYTLPAERLPQIGFRGDSRVPADKLGQRLPRYAASQGGRRSDLGTGSDH